MKGNRHTELQRGVPGDGGRVQPVGTCHDTNPCALWHGERQGQGQENWQAASNRRQHARFLPLPLLAYKSKQLNVSELARACDVSRTTTYKYIGLWEV